jgi:predicted  nucleic acid-binding Zn-ribbon protein
LVAGQIASTLHWMWKYKVTEAERVACGRLFAAASTELMDTNDRNIPDEFKRSSDPAPPADAREAESQADLEADPEADPEAEQEAEQEADLRANTVAEPVTELNIPDQPVETEPVSNAPAAVTTVASNTTAFSFWLAAEASTALPHIYDVDAATEKEGKRDLFAAGFHYGPEEANEKRWKAAHILGTGSSAVASLWVRQNETNHIEMVSIFSYGPTKY